MRAIINGKAYDTATAVRMGFWSNGRHYMDPYSKEETLFRKRTGEFFLLGQGGSETNYAERFGKEWTGSAKVMPLTFEEAENWSKEHLSKEEYELIFDLPEGNDKKTVSYSLSLAAIERLRRAASSAGISASELLEKLIGGLNDQGK
ncbi:MAG: hypothetical protein IJJ22_02370 [Oscillospiraceae bacterium]|nr:hypothetical protein [Oscillospiraceae bacterium]